MYKTTLVKANPELSKEWHPTKNGNLTPADRTPFSNEKVWWICSKKGHEWKTRIAHRSSGNGCPYCSNKNVCNDNCLAALNPQLAQEWHPKNKKTPYNVVPFSNEKVWWICSKKGHEWKTRIAHRSNGSGCPGCSGRIADQDNCLLILSSQLTQEWHPTKNGNLTPADVTISSSKKVWWICSKKGHEWESTIANRSSNSNGCPYCSGHKLCSDNCLLALNPKLAQEWHPTKNGSLTPSGVMPYSNKKRWWICSKKGHEWAISINHRSNGNGCPYCYQRVCNDNCLATLNPKLAQEWHPTKNGNLTPSDVMSHSAKKIWWKCSKGHEWDTRVYSRSNGHNCPHCREFKTEKKCRGIFEKMFDKPFIKTRKILGSLELDGYCKELNLAFEYNGEQHYQRVPHWHKTADAFEKQQARDAKKVRLCKEKGITLITIPYTEQNRLEEFIREQLLEVRV